MESNNWVFYYSPWSSLTKHQAYYSPWSSLTKHPAYYSPWSSLTKHPVITRNKLGVLSDLTRDSHKLGVWSDLTMESNNWVLVWPNTQLLLSMVRSDKTPSYYSPWSRDLTMESNKLGALSNLTLESHKLGVLSDLTRESHKLGVQVKFDKTPSYYSPCSSLTKQPVITLHGQVWQITQLLFSMVKSLTLESNKLGVWSDLTRESHKLGVWSDLTMESNNWVFGQTCPWRVITITLHGQVWPNTQLMTLPG
jgi:hypothetical protein